MNKLFKKSLYIIISSFLINGFSNCVYSQTIDDIKFMTEIYPPYNFIEKKELKGIAVDLLILMLEKVNSKQKREDIKLLPWARGYRNVLKIKNTCLFSTARISERENLFMWVGPIATIRTGLIAEKERNIKINDFEEIKKYRIGTVMEDLGERVLVEKGIKLEDLDRIGGVDVLAMSIEKLNRNRIDLLAYPENIIRDLLNREEANKYEMVYILQKTDIYFAFNKSTSDSIIKKLQRVLDEFKENGAHQKVLDKYFN